MSDKYIELTKMLLEAGHVDEAVEVLKRNLSRDAEKKTAGTWEISKEQHIHGSKAISARGHHGVVNIAYIAGRPDGNHYITYVRGVAGPSTAKLYKKGPHDSFEAAADEAYRVWNKVGRIWISE